MTKGKFIVFKITVVSLLMLPLALAAQIRSERQVANILARIETRTDSFNREVQLSLSRSPLPSTNREDRIAEFIADFERATDALRSGFNARRDINVELNEVLNRALFINRFLSRNRLTTRVQTEWSAIRSDLNLLSRLY